MEQAALRLAKLNSYAILPAGWRHEFNFASRSPPASMSPSSLQRHFETAGRAIEPRHIVFPHRSAANQAEQVLACRSRRPPASRCGRPTLDVAADRHPDACCRKWLPPRQTPPGAAEYDTFARR